MKSLRLHWEELQWKIEVNVLQVVKEEVHHLMVDKEVCKEVLHQEWEEVHHKELWEEVPHQAWEEVHHLEWEEVHHQVWEEVLHLVKVGHHQAKAKQDKELEIYLVKKIHWDESEKWFIANYIKE